MGTAQAPFLPSSLVFARFFLERRTVEIFARDEEDLSYLTFSDPPSGPRRPPPQSQMMVMAMTTGTRAPGSLFD